MPTNEMTITVTILVTIGSFIGGLLAVMVGMLLNSKPQIIVQHYNGDNKGKKQNDKRV